jgi:hypothetical protein
LNLLIIANGGYGKGAGDSGVQTRSHFDASGKNGTGLVYGSQAKMIPGNRKWNGGIYDDVRRKWLYPLSLNPGAHNAYRSDEFNHRKIAANQKF